MTRLTPDDIEDIITDLGCRNAAGGIYTGSVHEFARAIEQAARAQALEEAAAAAERVGSPAPASDSWGTRIVGTSIDAARAIRDLAKE